MNKRDGRMSKENENFKNMQTKKEHSMAAKSIQTRQGKKNYAKFNSGENDIRPRQRLKKTKNKTTRKPRKKTEETKIP